jgi:hypothetical protein
MSLADGYGCTVMTSSKEKPLISVIVLSTIALNWEQFLEGQVLLSLNVDYLENQNSLNRKGKWYVGCIGWDQKKYWPNAETLTRDLTIITTYSHFCASIIHNPYIADVSYMNGKKKNYIKWQVPIGNAITVTECHFKIILISNVRFVYWYRVCKIRWKGKWWNGKVASVYACSRAYVCVYTCEILDFYMKNVFRLTEQNACVMNLCWFWKCVC